MAPSPKRRWQLGHTQASFCLIGNLIVILSLMSEYRSKPEAAHTEFAVCQSRIKKKNGAGSLAADAAHMGFECHFGILDSDG
jgi:hypothetical protein